MSLHAFQEALLKLYTGSTTLEEFIKMPEEFLSQYDLTKKERIALASLPHNRLLDFRNGLRNKRNYVLQRMIAPYRYTAVALSSFGKKGPELCIEDRGNLSRLPISEGQHSLLQTLANAGQRISISNVTEAHRQAVNSSTKDLFLLVRLVKRYQLEGRKILLA